MHDAEPFMNPGQYRTIHVEVVGLLKVGQDVPPRPPNLSLVSDFPSSSPTIANPSYTFRYSVTSGNLLPYQEYVSIYTLTETSNYFLNFTDEMFVLGTAEIYTFQIDAILSNQGQTFGSADSEEIGSVAIDIEVNAPPEGGECAIQPSTALQLEPITVGCWGWSDPHLPLSYHIILHTTSQSVTKGTLTSRGTQPDFLVGKKNPAWGQFSVVFIGTHIVEIRVYDAHMWSSSVDLVISIEEDPNANIHPPSQCPTHTPTASNPTAGPTTSPTTRPTDSPTTIPSREPTADEPTVTPTSPPTEQPTNSPTYSPIDIGSSSGSLASRRTSQTDEEDYTMEYTIMTYMAIFICCCGSCSYVYLNYIAEPLYAKIHEWITAEEKVIHASIYDDPETQPDAFVVAQ